MQPTAWAFVIGTAIAYGGLMTRFAGEMYRDGDADRRTAMAEDHPVRWRLHNGLFALGAAVVAGGFVLLRDGPLSLAAAVAGGVGHILGTGFALYRLSVPARDWFHSARGVRLFWGYSGLSILGSVLLGIILLGDSAWMGIVLLASSAGLVAVVVWLRDLPPFTHYLALLAVGIGILV